MTLLPSQVRILETFNGTQAASDTAFKRACDRRRFMTSRLVRRGASYWSALGAAAKLIPLPERIAR